MPSKPIIDILAGVTTYDEFDLMGHCLATIGYLHTPESEADDPARRPPCDRDQRLLLVAHYRVPQVPAFPPDNARADAQLKRELAVKYENDPHSYTAAKSRFVTDVEHKAAWAHFLQTAAPHFLQRSGRAAHSSAP